MDIKVTKYSEDATIGVMDHKGQCVHARFYVFPDEGDRVKVDWSCEIPEKKQEGWEPGVPDFAEIAKAFKEKGVTVAAKDLQKVFEA